ncbi:MAG: DUF2284 domain-containing protein [Candidatus Hodarchaeales archaeon]|jgi:predicted metal-binding protein
MKETVAFRKDLEEIFTRNGFDDFKWIDPEKIVVSSWVRMKCMYGCPGYGNIASCPPNNPSVIECELFFREYKEAVIFHLEKIFDDPDDRHAWTKEMSLKLVDVEKEVFLSGYVKAFLLVMDSCGICKECTKERENCKHPKLARPTPEGMAVDVFATVKQVGYPISVLKDYTEKMNRYAFLMIE